ncbi:hypothetical protein L7E55_17195 [Pelotomaculum isophthalicicum JI]|uniref:Uncharacterized protein n=1 Tax=Pelotomaculum isophthalicicum JI TaxID=947010 RepID=A0A9X4H4T5_9FIRM|nr:hypothetical protein [Pelotomaculum isophthalicicum]MDF9410051.1 hypothetical protein [Pelotomaculum isophthalicicum JI]
MHPAILPWYIVISTSIPQTFLIFKIGFQLFNLDMSYSRALFLSFIISIIAIFARELPLLFGVHTFILIVFSTLLAFIITGTNLWHCFISIAAGALILGVLEGALLPILLNITAVTIDSLVLKPWLNILYFLPSGVIMVILYIFIKKYNFIIFDLSLDRD